MQNIIAVKNLTKRYGELTAVGGISFEVGKGEVFGILGPNGAGKTTTIEMIEGLRKPDAGSIAVCGLNALTETARVKERIGVQLQATSLWDNIRVEEAIDLFGGYYVKSVPTEQLMEEVSLTDKRKSPVSALSGGQKQRLSMALALVNNPEVLFMDEPSTGLDPQARHNVWSVVGKLQERGKTVVLTTHYMEEAETLCGRVAIIDHGSIIAMDTPDKLVQRADLGTRIEFCTSRDLHGITNRIHGIENISNGRKNHYAINTREASLVLKDLTNLCWDNKVDLEEITVKQATLEDVFLSMTGRKLRE